MPERQQQVLRGMLRVKPQQYRRQHLQPMMARQPATKRANPRVRAPRSRRANRVKLRRWSSTGRHRQREARVATAAAAAVGGSDRASPAAYGTRAMLLGAFIRSVPSSNRATGWAARAPSLLALGE